MVLTSNHNDIGRYWMNDIEMLKEAIKEALEERTHIGMEDHHLHHDWITLKMNKDRRRQEMWNSIKFQVAKSGILGIIGFFLYAAWIYLKQEVVK